MLRHLLLGGVCANPHLGVEELHALTGIQQLLLCNLPAPLSLLQRGPQLLDLSLQQVGSALHDRQLLLQVLLAPEGVVQVQLRVLSVKKYFDYSEEDLNS